MTNLVIELHWVIQITNFNTFLSPLHYLDGFPYLRSFVAQFFRLVDEAFSFAAVASLDSWQER